MKIFTYFPVILCMLTACGGSDSDSQGPQEPPVLDITNENLSDVTAYTMMVPELLVTFAEMSIEAHNNASALIPALLCTNKGGAFVERTADSLRIELIHCSDPKLDAVLNGVMAVGLKDVPGGTEYDMAIDLSMSSDYVMDISGSASIKHTISGTAEHLRVQSKDNGIALSAFGLTETIRQFSLEKQSDIAVAEYQLGYSFTYVSEVLGGVVTCQTDAPFSAPYFMYPANLQVSCGPTNNKLRILSSDDMQYVRITFPGYPAQMSNGTYYEASLLTPITPPDIPMLYEYLKRPSSELEGLSFPQGRGQIDRNGEYAYLESTEINSELMKIDSTIYKLRLSDLSIASKFTLDIESETQERFWLSAEGNWLYVLATVDDPDGLGTLTEILIIDTADMTVVHTVDPIPVFAPREAFYWNHVGMSIAPHPTDDDRWTLVGLANTTPEQVIVAEFRKDVLLREARHEMQWQPHYSESIATTINEEDRLFISLEENFGEVATLRFNLGGEQMEHERTAISTVTHLRDRISSQRTLFAFEGRLYTDLGLVFNAETLELTHENRNVNKIYLNKSLRRLIDLDKGKSLSLEDASYYRQSNNPKYWSRYDNLSLLAGEGFVLYMDRQGTLHRVGLGDL